GGLERFHVAADRAHRPGALHLAGGAGLAVARIHHGRGADDGRRGRDRAAGAGAVPAAAAVLRPGPAAGKREGVRGTCGALARAPDARPWMPRLGCPEPTSRHHGSHHGNGRLWERACARKAFATGVAPTGNWGSTQRSRASRPWTGIRTRVREIRMPQSATIMTAATATRSMRHPMTRHTRLTSR